jgi:hypothetical protein
VRCLLVTTDARGSKDIPLDVVDATLRRAVSNWTTRTDGCAYLLLASKPGTRVADVAIDGQPTVVFRNETWARPGASMPHDPSAIGLTTVFYVDTPGLRGDATILDADVELNNVNYTFTTDPASAQPRSGTMLADLENTMTHELGHVQGLAHTCWDHLTPEPPLDNLGNSIPDCNGVVPQSILQTTMYPYALMPGETSKRHLSDDDVKGVCDVYPSPPPGAPAPACFADVEGGCGIARGRPGRWAATGGPLRTLPALIALAMLLWRRRRCTR